MIKKFLDILNNSNKVAILSHSSPDGDAFGSSLMIYEFIDENFPNIEKAVFYDSYSPVSRFSPMLKEKIVNPKNIDYDTVVVVDCGDMSRFKSFSTIFDNASHTVSFDHHPNNQNYAELNFVSLKSSNCENIYNELVKTGLKLNNQLLKYCYVGMLTDSKNFTINSVTPSTHEIVAEIMKKGIDTHAIFECIYSGNEINSFKLLGYAINKTKFYLSNLVMITKLTKHDLKKFNISENDTQGLINQIFDVKDCLACFLMTPRGKYTHVSMRSKDDIDVSILATSLGGGGHKCASACDTKINTKKLKNIIIKKMEEQINNYSPKCNDVFSK